MIRELEEKEYSSILNLAKTLKKGFSLNEISSKDKLIVCEKNSQIRGFLGYSRLYETVDILYIVVDENYRRSGIGTKLIDYLVNLDGVKHIMLEVRKKNMEAIEFYRKNGFIVLREIKNYYEDDDALVMEKVI